MYIYTLFLFFLNIIYLFIISSIFSPPVFFVISNAFVSGTLNVPIPNPIKAKTIGQKKYINAIKNNFVNYEEVREFLLSQPKFGNNIDCVDNEAKEIANRVSNMIRKRKNM